MHGEQSEAKSRGSDWSWRVQKDYHIDGGILKEGFRMGHSYGTLGPSHWYYPFARPELVAAVAHLIEGDEKAVLEFAHQWGLLGYDGLIPYHPGWVDSFGDDPSDESKWVIQKEERRGGDPLRWIWAHAETVRRVLRLIGLLDKCREAAGEYDKGTKQVEAPVKELESSLATMSRLPLSATRPSSASPPGSWKSGDGYLYTTFDMALGIEPIETVPDIRVAQGVTVVTSPEDMKWGNPMTPQRMAKEVVAHVLNGNLDGLRPLILPRGHDHSGPERTFTFPAMLTAVYWHLSDIAIGGKAYIQCQWCERWIQREHGHQRYCPPQEKGKESLCSLKARQDRWKESQSRKEEDNGKAQA